MFLAEIIYADSLSSRWAVYPYHRVSLLTTSLIFCCRSLSIAEMTTVHFKLGGGGPDQHHSLANRRQLDVHTPWIASWVFSPSPSSELSQLDQSPYNPFILIIHIPSPFLVSYHNKKPLPSHLSHGSAYVPSARALHPTTPHPLPRLVPHPPPGDLQAARLARQGQLVDIEALKADKQHAERLAKLAASASARGAAPPPPGKGGAAKPPPAPAGVLWDVF